MRCLTVLVLAACLLGTDVGVETRDVPDSHRKVWKRNSLFSNPTRWAHGSKPCHGDRIIFPRDLQDEPAFLDESVTVEVREMLLPWNGELVFPYDVGQLVIGGDDFRSKGCPGRDMLWQTAPTPSWLDPGNWQAAAVQSSDPEAVPHLERIPCGQDVAYFPHGAFQLQVPSFPVRVGAIYFGQAEHIQRLFKSSPWFMWHLLVRGRFRPARPWLDSSDILMLMADSIADLEALGPQCGLPASAPPPGKEMDVGHLDDVDEMKRAVCQYVTCPIPACANPVRPHLHCCFECGAVLELRPAPDQDDVRRLVRDVQLENGPKSGPLVHVGVVPTAPAPGMLQVVLLGDAADEFAARLQDLIRADGGLSHVRANLLLSGALMAPSTAGSVIGTLLGSLLVVILVLFILVYAIERPSSRLFLMEKQKPFLFARFENSAGEEEGGVAVDVVSKGVRSARGSWSARSFRNPLFEQSHEDRPLPQSGRPASRGVAHENALFTELQRRVDGAEDVLDNVSDGLQDQEPAPSSTLPEEGKLVDVTL